MLFRSRILAATNRDLEKQIEEGGFREDLFYRLETFHLAIPPLKDRREDIEWLAGRFIYEAAEELSKTVEGISEEALRMLNNYPFPGNIRELKNILRRAVAFANQPLLNVNDLPEKIRQATPSVTGEGFRLEGELPSMETMRRRYACFVLDRCGGNKRETARLLGLSRQTLYALLREE